MLSLRSLLDVPIISKAIRPFRFLSPSRILSVYSNWAQSFLSRAPSTKSTLPPNGFPQQYETDFRNLTIGNNKSQDRREQRRQDCIGQHAENARLDKGTQTERQPLPDNFPTPLIRPVISSKVQKIPIQTVPNPSFISKSVITAIAQSQDAIPPSTSVNSETALLKSTLTSLNPPMISTTPSSETQPAQPAQLRAAERSPPAPHAIYLSLASLIPTRLLIPQRLLIVLDLNGTLLFREVGSTAYKQRPFLKNFLDYCIQNHVILIWSSAKPHNVDAICKQLFTPEQHQKLLGVWARDTLGLTPAQYNSKTQVYKNLDYIWANPSYAFRHPWFHAQGLIWSQKNTLLVDDSILKARAQPYNHIEIPEFLRNSNEATAQNGKDVLGQVTAYLEEARMWDNVSAFVRQTRFKINREWAWNWEKGKGPEKAQLQAGWMSEGNNSKKEETIQLSDDDDEKGGRRGGVKLTGHWKSKG